MFSSLKIPKSLTYHDLRNDEASVKLIAKFLIKNIFLIRRIQLPKHFIRYGFIESMTDDFFVFVGHNGSPPFIERYE